jgi:uncharacterized membrane protein YgcG
MATGNKLEVGIGADITEFEKKIKEVEFDIKELSKLKLDKLKLGLDTSEINNNIKDAKKSLNELKGTVKDSGSSFSSMAPKVANGSNALMQFSRIAQDAPYGIIGIGNNITATTEAFGYLKQQTGSTGGALKAMASSLMGSGGILLGVSLLTTAFTLLSQSGLSVGDLIDKLTGNFNDFNQSLRKASEEGAKSAASEVFGLKALVSAAQNKSLSDKERLIAVENLQKQYPAYFGNLSKEKILTSDLTSVVNDLTKALISKAIAEKLAADSAEIQLDVYKANARLVDQKNKTSAIELDFEKKITEARAQNNGGLQLAANLNARKNNAVAESVKLENEARDSIIKGTNALKQRQDVINKLTASSIKLNASAIPNTPKEKEIKKPKFEFQKGFIPGGIVAPAINFDSMLLSMDIVPDEVSAKLLELKKLLNDFNAEANDIIGGSITSTFQNLGDSIGNALANGGNVLSAIGKSLIQSLGMFLSDMGGLLIKYGVLAIAKGKLDVAIAAGGPLSIGAGVAAIAVGIALKAAGGALSSKASGGQGANTSTGSTANNSSFSSGGFSSSSGNGGTVVFEIAGQKLIGVLSNTLNANKRLGGQLGL